MALFPVASLTVTVKVKGAPGETFVVPPVSDTETAKAGETVVDRDALIEELETSVAVTVCVPGDRKMTTKFALPEAEVPKVKSLGRIAFESDEVK